MSAVGLHFQVRKYLALDVARSRKYTIDWSSYVPGEGMYLHFFVHSCSPQLNLSTSELLSTKTKI